MVINVIVRHILTKKDINFTEIMKSTEIMKILVMFTEITVQYRYQLREKGHKFHRKNEIHRNHENFDNVH